MMPVIKICYLCNLCIIMCSISSYSFSLSQLSMWSIDEAKTTVCCRVVTTLKITLWVLHVLDVVKNGDTCYNELVLLMRSQNTL